MVVLIKITKTGKHWVEPIRIIKKGSKLDYTNQIHKKGKHWVVLIKIIKTGKC